MTDTHDDTRQQLGRVDGLLTALEGRIDRHESFVTQKLASIEEKLDQALLTHARNAGAARVIHWVASVVASLAAWALGRFTGSPGTGH